MEDDYNKLSKENTVELANCSIFVSCDEKEDFGFNYISVIEKSIKEILNTMDCPKADKFELSIRLTNAEEIKNYNKIYRGKDAPTNVLSFEYDLEDDFEFEKENGFAYIGDIICAVPVVKQQAQDQNKTVENHFAHLFIHSVLHLFGFEHIEEKETEIMESLEIQILKKMQIDNPYLIKEDE